MKSSSSLRLEICCEKLSKSDVRLLAVCNKIRCQGGSHNGAGFIVLAVAKLRQRHQARKLQKRMWPSKWALHQKEPKLVQLTYASTAARQLTSERRPLSSTSRGRQQEKHHRLNVLHACGCCCPAVLRI